ncbi:MAG: M23 family metallopeptidase [Nevskia sp.]|nr:M23 family metallopeptidase [Nevskia sp.]
MTVKPARFPTQRLAVAEPKLTDKQEALLKTEAQVLQQAKITESDRALWQGPFQPPVAAPISTVFGTIRYFNGRYDGYHRGVDFRVGGGANVGAAQAGRVLLARYLSPFNPNGNVVYVDHGQGIVSAYLHLSRILVKEGQPVKAGQAVGLVGSSGRSTGPHLHWSVFIHGISVDGLQWVALSRSLAPPSAVSGL